MSSAIVRLLAASAAAAVLAGAFLFSWFSRKDSDVAFGKVLEKVAQAKTLHVKVTRADKTGDVWVQQPRRLRWDNPDGTYQIADGAKLWLVDEKANRAAPQKSAYFPEPDKSGLDLLALLDVPHTSERQDFLDKPPAGRVQRDGIDCLVYRMEVPAAQGKIEIEALAEAATHRLHSLAAKTRRNDEWEQLGELTMVAYNPPVSQQRFVVKDTLTEDGRLGKVLDIQGIVAVKPVMHQRWTPVRNQMLVKPGDWVRTDVRGANAVELSLVKRTTLILGPGTLAELVKPDLVRLLAGEVEIAAPPGVAVELLGPEGQKTKVTGTELFRHEGDKLARIDKEPRWLAGFKGAIAHESLGSLVARVDGRNVSLTVGYHKVSVDIRDQIARTTIEESFVNHTDGLLEGVFHFPLPQDASISGFGMWIGNNLVEADVVEKQRAREIYETILQEKRDPGLLEWSGGNLFKARVYPIFAHSEKRIKITYTQVLPRKGHRYRYSYALQSEMLQQHPLRELAIDVKVNSVVPLKGVSSPTHETRIDQTAHAAHVEFSAQEYVPTRDFEVVIEVDGKQAEVVVIPHRRGDDGYFMLELMPRAAGAEEERDVLADGPPLQLLILADTSAAMDAGQRKAQEAFVAALLTALASKDTINLAACDVNCDWVFEKAVSAEPANLTKVRRFLARRSSLGWSDLDKAFASAFARSGPATQVIYIGGGIVTARGDGDPAAFSQRLRRLYEGKQGTCHAVAVGSSFEPGVLKAIGALGGGSVRQLSGDRGPQAAALDLLQEMAQPPLRELKVEFKGVRTARVYPEQLPNLPAGTQQIVLGRCLPEGRDQTGEVVVTGLQGAKPVEFRSRFTLPDAEEGNSFIPRLWARMHLDHLLAQGTSDAVKDEIIALSEEYQIITPYTSLLVLETDADRERFKVKRRFQMRDGERFFAQGRDNANYALVQQQMKRAGNWRLGLRRAVLQQLAALGRDVRVIQAARDYKHVNYAVFREGAVPVSWSAPAGGPSRDLFHLLDFVESDSAEFDAALKDVELGWFGSDSKQLLMKDDEPGIDESRRELAEASPVGGDIAPGSPEPEMLAAAGGLGDAEARDVRRGDELSSNGAMSRGRRLGDLGRLAFPEGYGFFASGFARNQGWFERGPSPAVRTTQWLDVVFPSLAPAPRKAKEPNLAWPAPAHALAQSLLRTDRLARMTGGVEINRRVERFDSRWDELTGRSERVELFSTAAWLTRSEGDDAHATVEWCDGQERGLFSRPFQLGRLRTSTPQELTAPPLALDDYSLTSIEQAHAGHTAQLEPAGKDRMLLVLKPPSDPHSEMRVLIDTVRHVILTVEQRRHGKLTSTTKFEDFVEAAGCWWARRIETTDEQGRRASRITQAVKPLAQEELDRRVRLALAGRNQILFIHEPLPDVIAAKRSVAGGKPSFEDRLVLLAHFAGSQQWARALEHWQQAEQLASGKPGLRWLRDAFLNVSRRHEELKKRVFEEAARLAEAPDNGDARRDELFLADHLSGQARGFLPAHEMLALLDRLQPVYRRQPAHLRAPARWQQQRVDHLQQVGQTDEALRLSKQLAADSPHDANLQQRYAQALANTGAHAEAYAWLTRVLGEGSRWNPGEEESLRGLYAQLLESQGRFSDLAAFLADGVKRNPEGSSAYGQYLSALIRANRMDEANAKIAQWLQEGQAAGDLSPAAASRLEAAVAQALGQGHNLYSNRLEDRWLAPLVQAVLVFVRHDDRLPVADRIMGHSQFQSRDECRQVRKAIADILAAEVETLSPGRVQRYVNWIMQDSSLLGTRLWNDLLEGLRKRWSAETNAEARHQLGQVVVQLLSSRFSPGELLAFERLLLREGPKVHRAAYANQLFNTLLSQPWSAEYEDEGFTLMDKLSDTEEPGERLAAQVAALHRLTDKMIDARFTARMKRVEHREKLSRTELHGKKTENLRLVRTECADRLRKEAGKHSALLESWLTIERLYLETLLERELPKVAAACWEFLRAQPAGLALADEDQDPGRALDQILRDRFLTTLANLAARPNAEPALVERLLKYIDDGIASGGEDPRWKLLKYRLLIALDRPKDLEQSLRQWIQPEDTDNRWRLPLGYLLAEQGRIPEAIKLFEAIEKADELGPSAYRTLADWYMVVNQRDRHNRAKVAAYKSMDEWRLSRAIQARLYPWQQADKPLPTELDKEVLVLFQALFEKATSPQNYLGQLQQFYQASHDFRLLAGLADAVVGHSAGRVYPFLQGMQSVLAEVRDEATADEMVRHIADVRKRAQTAVDRRALDLLELQVERRAAELKNQPGPHSAAALAAMERAFKEKWSADEPGLMADLLAGLGKISATALAKEQLRQLETLHREGAKGSFDRLHLAHCLARGLGNYDHPAQAIELLQSALNEFQEAQGGVLPVSANGALDTLISFLEGAGRHQLGEKILSAQLRKPVHSQQEFWLIQRLNRLHHHALETDRGTSLSSGRELYKALQARILQDVDTPDHGHRQALISRLCAVQRTAHEKKMPEVPDDLKAFAFDRLPSVLKPEINNRHTIVNEVARTVHDLVGPREGVAVLVNEIETEPYWFRLNNQDGWNQFAWTIGQWRDEAKSLGDALDARLLKIIIGELKRDLASRQYRNRVMYDRRHGYFWAEKEEAFARAAEEVLAPRNQSGAAIQYLAEYFFRGLNRPNRAIDIFSAAHSQKLLDETGQLQLVGYLHEQKRHGESIALLEPWVKDRPENLHYRVLLMSAYFHTSRPDDLLGLLKETDKFFHQEDRWTEGVAATLASSCLRNQLYEQTAAYFQEVIPWHQRTHPRRGSGDSALSEYYRQLALAQNGLGKTAEAVEAASAAIVCWSPHHRERRHALETLQQVLREARDLDAYVAHLDAQSGETGLFNPVVRKAVGQAYAARGQYPQAVVQLQLASDLEPNDAETFQLLIDCCDRQGDRAGAVAQVLRSLQHSRRDLKRYQDLGRRLEGLDQKPEAERAYTSIIAVLPNESESHALLAEIRQQQDRWAEAITHWDHVARIRALEPTGLLKLAAAQVHERQWDQAAQTLRQVTSRSWPPRFGDVGQQVLALEKDIEKGRR
jgi:predicted Zn-dependent protease